MTEKSVNLAILKSLLVSAENHVDPKIDLLSAHKNPELDDALRTKAKAVADAISQNYAQSLALHVTGFLDEDEYPNFRGLEYTNQLPLAYKTLIAKFEDKPDLCWKDIAPFFQNVSVSEKTKEKVKKALEAVASSHTGQKSQKIAQELLEALKADGVMLLHVLETQKPLQDLLTTLKSHADTFSQYKATSCERLAALKEKAKAFDTKMSEKCKDWKTLAAVGVGALASLILARKLRK
jgi:hypothetical protein